MSLLSEGARIKQDIAEIKLDGKGLFQFVVETDSEAQGTED